MTLDCAVVNFQDAFAPGQVYTALSRVSIIFITLDFFIIIFIIIIFSLIKVRSRDGLEIQGAINPSKITISGRVKRFDEEELGYEHKFN
jgi:hypothetical protein